MVLLLLIIRGYCCRFDNNQQSIYVLKSAKYCISAYYQGYKVTITEYVEHFKALVGIVETYGGAYGNELGLIKAQLLEQGVSVTDIDTPNVDKLKKALMVCDNSYLLCMILQGSDNSRLYITEPKKGSSKLFSKLKNVT